MSVFTPVVPEGMEAFYNDYQFSPAVKCGDFLIISGQLGFDADGSLPSDVNQQMANAFAAIGQILSSQGLDFANIVTIDSFHVGDMHSHFEAMIAEKARYISEPHPGWTAVAVAGLALPEALVEIKVMASLSFLCD